MKKLQNVFHGNSLRAATGLVMAASAVGCTNLHSHINTDGIAPKSAVSAPLKVQDSLGASSVLVPGKQDQVVIKKEALEKEFLFSGSIIPQSSMATSHGLVSRIVAFRKVGQKVFMLEATQGHVVSPTLPSTLILASFPILNETGDLLVIDFNAGMNQVFTDSGGYASDESGKDYADTNSVAPVRQSYLSSVKIVGNALEIRQIAQLTVVSGYKDFELRYLLEPYHPNPKFTPTEGSDFRHVGFFESNPIIEPSTGRTSVRIAKRDLAKPIVYAISANIPAQYHDAARDGALYWNHVFGKEVVQVIDAPAGVTAPDPNYNVIQWVENDLAGMSYADMLMDPRSGEILHSQVFLTSAFGVREEQTLPAAVRQYTSGTLPAFKKGLLTTQSLCDLHDDPSGELAMVAVKAQSAVEPSGYLRVSQDYIRFVVAHEVGHTLGLRHNFAGSLAETSSPDQVDAIFKQYLLKGTPPPRDQVFSSSTMEYTALAESMMIGSMYRTPDFVLPHDKVAIDWGYFGTAIDETTVPPFCTDPQADSIADCMVFDRGAKPIVSASMALGKALRLMAASLAEGYIQAKTPADPRDAIPASKLALDPVGAATSMVSSLKSEIGWLKSGGNPSIVVMNRFPVLSSFYRQDIISEQDESVASQFAEAGGVESVLSTLLRGKLDPKSSFAAQANLDLAAYLARDDVKNGVSPRLTPYSLSADEIAFIQAQGKKYFQKVEDEAFDQALAALADGTYTNEKLAPEIEKMLGNVAEQIIMTKSSKQVPRAAAAQAGATDATDAQAAAPQPAYEFAYSRKERALAVMLLKRSLGPSNADAWSYVAREKIAEELSTYLTQVAGGDPTKVDPATLGEPMANWFVEQLNFLQVILKAIET